MLETLMENQVIFYAMGAAAGIGVLSKLIAHFTLRRLVRAASKMNKSNHKFMRLVKAKFEHASMVSDRVQNVEAFLKKYVYEYRVFGIRLHTWQRLQKKSIWFVGIAGAAGAAAEYYLYEMNGQMMRYGAWAAAGVIALFLLHISGDENYRLQMAENYMTDFLENVCVHRYARTQLQKDVRQAAVLTADDTFPQEGSSEAVPGTEAAETGSVNAEAAESESQKADTGSEGAAKAESRDGFVTEEGAPEEPEKGKISQEVRIREILEEFLA